MIVFLGSPRVIVEKVLVCDCGFEARAADDEALAAEVQRHASEAHAMALSREEALVLAFRAEPVDNAPRTIARDLKTQREREER